MSRRPSLAAVTLMISTIALLLSFSGTCPAQEWKVAKARGTLRVVDLSAPDVSVNLMYSDFLISKDKDNTFVPSLAEDWRWVTDRTIEFRLRRGVTFHNGEAFNAEAVRINWEAYRKMESPCMWRFLNLPDDTIFEIVDEYTVRFTLPAPAFFSKHTFKEFNWSQLEEPGPWGAGPFRLVEGSALYTHPSERVVLEAFEDYWDRRYPKVQRVIFENRFLGDRKEAMRLCMEEEGFVDIVGNIRPLDTLRVAESPHAKVVKSRDVRTLTGWFNQRKRDSKWRDLRLRKALNYAINREELWKHGAKGNAYNLGGSIPPGAYGHDPALVPYGYDTTRARALLAEAGYPNGFGAKIIAPEHLRVETQIISRMLERIGLKVSFEILPSPAFWRKTFFTVMDGPPEEQDWDISLLAYFDSVSQVGLTFLLSGFLEISDSRWIEYDPAYEEMWREMVRTKDCKVKEEKVKQMSRYVYDRAYALFIYSPLTLYAVNKEVDLVPFKDGYLNLRETSVSDRHWSIRNETK